MIALKSVDFRREREATWRELETLCMRVERFGLGTLTATELQRLPSLYRSVLSALSVARAISLDKNVLEYLDTLAARAYLCVYAEKRPLRESLAAFFGAQFPAAVRRFWPHVLVSTGFLVAGVLVGFFLVRADADRFYALVDGAYAQGRGPAATTKELRDILYQKEGEAARLTVFASFLFTHNAKIGILCFALGFAFGIPVFLLLLTNGFLLGAFAALYHSRDLALDFWAWVLPHGVTEIGAVILCAAGGLVIAETLVFGGPRGRLYELAIEGRRAGVLALGAVFLFLVAGLIEGVFRQTVQDVGVRLTVVAASVLWWGYYFGRGGRRRA